MPTMIWVMPTMAQAMPTVVWVMPTMARAMPTMVWVMPTMVQAMPTMARAMPTMVRVMPTMGPGDAHHGTGDAHRGMGDAHYGTGDAHHGTGDAHHGTGDSHHSTGDAHRGTGSAHLAPLRSTCRTRGFKAPRPGEWPDLSDGAGESQPRQMHQHGLLFSLVKVWQHIQQAMPELGMGSSQAPPGRGTVAALAGRGVGTALLLAASPGTSSLSGLLPVLAGAEQGRLDTGHGLLWGFLGSQLGATSPRSHDAARGRPTAAGLPRIRRVTAGCSHAPHRPSQPAVPAPPGPGPSRCRLSPPLPGLAGQESPRHCLTAALTRSQCSTWSN